MRKYAYLWYLTIKEYFAYRLNFVLWRFRMFLNLLFTFFLWSSVFDSKQTFGSYPKSALLSYILYSSLISTFVLGSRTAEIAGQINDGGIINQLLKPVSFFRYHLIRDLADKTMNVAFALCEFGLVWALFQPPLVLPRNVLVFAPLFVCGVVISFAINLLLSFIGFWTTEVWAPRFLFLMLVLFVSGSYFPLDLLPRPLYTAMLMTPFPYLFYVPAQVLTGRIIGVPVFELVMALVWSFLLYRIAVLVFRRGNRSFSFWGR